MKRQFLLIIFVLLCRHVKGNTSFTFSLQAFYFPNHTLVVPNPIRLNSTLYFKAMVVTYRADPNVDLFPVHCWSSKSADPMVADGDFDLIRDGCTSVKDDLRGTLYYNCTDNDIDEHFSLRTHRYFAEPDSLVYIHCILRVCPADAPNSACKCPAADECDLANRKKQSRTNKVDESGMHRVRSGPLIFRNKMKEEPKQVNKEEDKCDEQENSQSCPSNLAIIVAASSVVAVAIICAAVYLIETKTIAGIRSTRVWSSKRRFRWSSHLQKQYKL